MISKFKEFEKLLEKISNQITKKTNLFIIGGAVLLYHGLKNATKDIDIVVETKEEYDEIKKSLKELEFKEQNITNIYKKLDISKILTKDNYRIDLFQKTVCKGFILSENMKKRATKISQIKNLSIFLCSKTDIFMFKTFTERPGDIDDCILLSRENLEWEEMLKEIKFQIKTAGKPVWITYLGERFDLLEEKGLQIPILEEINKLSLEYFKHLENKFK